VVNNMTVLPAVVAFPCAERVALAASHVLAFEGTGVSAAGRPMAYIGRAEGPTGAGTQGTGVSAGWLGAGTDQPYGRQRITFLPIDPTTLTTLTALAGTTKISSTKTDPTKNDVVVDDIPGVRYWSPPV
jgi:hypothetical protein